MSNYREKCLSASNNRCWVCDSNGDLEAHHIDGDRDNNNIGNLVALCVACHNEVHNTLVGNSQDEIEHLKGKLPPEKKTTIDGSSKTITFSNDQFLYIVATMGDDENVSERVRELVDKGMEVEQNDD